MSFFPVKQPSKFKKPLLDLISEGKNSKEKPIAAVIPHSIGTDSNKKSEPEGTYVSQFNLDEDNLWDEDEILAEVSKDTSFSQETSKLEGSTDDLKANYTNVKESSFEKEVIDESDSEQNYLDEEEIKDDFDLESQLLDMGLKRTPSPVQENIDFDVGMPNDFFDAYSPKPMLSLEVTPTKASPFKSSLTYISPHKSDDRGLFHRSAAFLPRSDSYATDIDSALNRFELKPLEINAQTEEWLEDMAQNQAFYKITEETPINVLQDNVAFLNKSNVEILEKAMTVLEKIPVEILSKFPDFDQDVFFTLRTTRRRIKAKIIQTENLIKRKPSEVLTPKTPENFQVSDRSLAYKDNFNSSLNDTPLSNNNGNSISQFSRPADTSLENAMGGSRMFGTPAASTSRSPKSSKLKSPKALGNSSFVDYTDLLYKTPKSTSTSGDKPTTMRNDGASAEFDGLSFPHSVTMMDMFAIKFGLKSFRTNQLQVVNAALLGHDCFVLMPTGGGKSLCYQLPAVVSKGVTIVISPLRSLIFDQVTKLNTLDIPACHLSGDITESEANIIYNKLNQPIPSIKLLYVTPEKLTASNTLRNCFNGLYNRGVLARFVIDEVHCVSQWGHDFRPDYKKLKELRERYPKVPIMALTATATPRVRTDILHQLQMTNPKWFLSSFNRSNLVYSVREKKGKAVIKEIASLIQKDFKNQTGVIYCFSRKECEDVARDLRACGVSTIAYHAGLPDKERTRIQTLWMNDKAKVVCATIAFGMGIDKLDVRFVLHYTLPKSIEGYYQESGRAGRDGERAVCILYFAHKDRIRLLKLINMDQSPGGAAARKVHIDNLYRVVAFAENKTDCRRALQLEYFGEKFDRKLCLANRSTACDNCLEQGDYDSIDVSKESRAIVTSVKQICGGDGVRGGNFTMLHFVDVFKGSTIKKILNDGHNNIPLYGIGKSWARLDVERLFRKLIMEEYLKERLMVKDDGITLAYLKPGRRAEELLQSSRPMMFHVKKKRSAADATATTTSSRSVDPAILDIRSKCYDALHDILKGIATALNCNINAIMNTQALRAMSIALPETAEQMLSINHVTQANFDKYGAALLDVTRFFAEEQKKIMPAPPPPVRKEPEPAGDEWHQAGFDDDSPYFDAPDITYMGRGGKRRRKAGGRKWPSAKRSKSSGRGGGTSRGRGKTTASSARPGSSSGPSSRPTAPSKPASSTLMELPTSKARFPRPKTFLSML